MSERTRKILEAQLVVPDRWMAALGSVFASAVRSGRLPKDSPTWLTDLAPKTRRVSDAPPPAAPAPTQPAAAQPPAAPATPFSSSRTGRSLPATNRFVSGAGQQPQTARATPSRAAAPKPTGFAADSDGPVDWAHATTAHPQKGALSRAWSALRGKDPENNLKVPKKAANKLPKAAATKPNLPDFSRIPDDDGGDDEKPYQSPFSGIQLPPEDDSDDADAKKLAKSLSSFKKKAAKPTPAKDDFDDEDTDPDAEPLGSKKESRLVRIFTRNE